MNTRAFATYARVLSFTLVLSIAPLPAIANNPPEAENQQIEIDPLDKIILWYPVGSDQVFPRGMAWGAHISTRWMVEHHVNNILDLGVRRIQLHNPGGFDTDVDPAMQFDQWLQAIDEVPVAAGDFVEQWKPIVSRPDMDEVIAYIGSPRLDHQQRLLRGNLPHWWQRAWTCVKPFVESGMTIGLDAAAKADPDEQTEHPHDSDPDDHLTTELAQMLMWMNIRVYVESRPWNHNPLWKYVPYQTLTGVSYTRLDPLHHADSAARRWRDDDIQEEIVFLIRNSDVETPNLDVLREHLLTGHTATLFPKRLADKDEFKSDMPGILEFLNLPHYPHWVVMKGVDEDGDELTFRIVSQPQNGTLEYLVPGEPKAKIKYTANPGFTGVDSFTYVANDGSQDSQPATVTLVVYGQQGERPFGAPPRDRPPEPSKETQFVPYNHLFHPHRGEQTNITFDLVSDDLVTLRVLKPWGEPVRTLLLDQEMSAGQYVVSWDGTDGGGNFTSAGFYLIELQTPDMEEPVKSAVVNNSQNFIVFPPIDGPSVPDDPQDGNEPTGFTPFQNAFNPSQGESSAVEFNLNSFSHVFLSIRSLQSGETIKTLIDATLPASHHSISWDGRNDQGSLVSSGIYRAILKVGDSEFTKKIAVLR